jgi:cytoskeletal protein CcmA (bactofilin family)
MWKLKDLGKSLSSATQQPSDTPSGSPATAAVQPVISATEVRPIVPSHPIRTLHRQVAHIGKFIVIKGELSGNEDLYLDGEVEGTIKLHGHKLVIGPNGRLRAQINACDVVIEGRVEGNVYGSERVCLRQSAFLVGDIATKFIVMEEGAYFQGRIDIHKDAPEVKLERTKNVRVN